MRKSLTIMTAAVMLAAAPASAQDNNVATEVNAGTTATIPADPAATPADPMMDPNLVAPAPDMTPVSTAQDPVYAPTSKKQTFPWGLLGLIGLIGLIGRARRSR